MKSIERRTIELEFYVVLQLIYAIKKDADFLVSMLESLHFLVNFNIEKVIYYTNKFNLDVLWQPYKGEVIGVLYKYSKLPMNSVCTALDISRTTGYKLANTYLNDPYESQPLVPEKDIQELKNVVEAYKQLRSAF